MKKSSPTAKNRPLYLLAILISLVTAYTIHKDFFAIGMDYYATDVASSLTSSFSILIMLAGLTVSWTLLSVYIANKCKPSWASFLLFISLFTFLFVITLIIDNHYFTNWSLSSCSFCFASNFNRAALVTVFETITWPGYIASLIGGMVVLKRIITTNRKV